VSERTGPRRELPVPAASGPADSAALARRARRLLRWYPATWRARYGEEFTELLMADLAELPRCWHRTADVARGGLRARLADAGLAASPLNAAASRRASLAALTGSAATFLTTGAALWAQLTVSWQWGPPATIAVATAMVVMSAGMLLFAVLAFAAFVPLAWAAVRDFARGRGRRLRLPAVLLTAGATVLVTGGRHFGNGWPGTAWVAERVAPYKRIRAVRVTTRIPRTASGKVPAARPVCPGPGRR
jgi:hypothetical protein